MRNFDDVREGLDALPKLHRYCSELNNDAIDQFAKQYNDDLGKIVSVRMVPIAIALRS